MSFKVGDIVWAHAENQPIWPAKVKSKIPAKPGFYRVSFFNESTYADLEDQALVNYKDNRHKYQKANSDKAFREALRLADQAFSEAKHHSESKSNKKGKSPKEVVQLKKRKRPPVDQKEEVVKKGAMGRKKVQKNKPEPKTEVKQEPEPEDIEEPEPQSEQHQPSLRHSQSSPSVSPAFHQPVAIKTAQDVLQSPRFMTLKQVRKRINHLLLELSLTSDPTPKFSSQALTGLRQLPSYLSRPQLQVEDLLNTRASSMLYFIIKRLWNIGEFKTNVEAIANEMARLKGKIMEHWVNTERLDRAFEGMSDGL